MELFLSVAEPLGGIPILNVLLAGVAAVIDVGSSAS